MIEIFDNIEFKIFILNNKFILYYVINMYYVINKLYIKNFNT